MEPTEFDTAKALAFIEARLDKMNDAVLAYAVDHGAVTEVQALYALVLREEASSMNALEAVFRDG